MKETMPSFVSARKKFHAELLTSVVSLKPCTAAIADTEAQSSLSNAKAMLTPISMANAYKKQPRQITPRLFEDACCDFLASTFPLLSHLRPGQWDIQRTDETATSITDCEQYAHLKRIEAVCCKNATLRLSLGANLVTTPTIIVLRRPEPDSVVNNGKRLVDGNVSMLTPIREVTSTRPILHASVTCALNMQNARTIRSDALNLIRHRKGCVPHIVVITTEPRPCQIASLAMGTGEIDCIYHFALYELQQTVATQGHKASQKLLRTMIEENRLRDITDLPFDLAT